MDLYYIDPAQHIITAGQDLDYLDRVLTVRCVICLVNFHPFCTDFLSLVDMPFVFWAEQTPNISTAGVGRSFSLQLHKTSSGFSALRHPTSKTTPPKGNLVPVYHSVRKCQEGFGVLIGLPKRPQHFRNIVVIFCMSCIYFYVSGRSRPTVDHLNLNPPL